jgi:hypothetical protein
LFEDVSQLSNSCKDNEIDDNTNQVEPERYFSTLDMIKSSKESVEHKIFLINYGSLSDKKRYVQIKFTKFHQNNQDKFMLQIIDVSHSIMYD